MAKAQETPTARLVYTAGNGDKINVTVAEDAADAMVGTGGGAFSKPSSARKSTSSE